MASLISAVAVPGLAIPGFMVPGVPTSAEPPEVAPSFPWNATLKIARWSATGLGTT